MSFLTKKIINFEPEIFGLDLSDMSVKVFEIEREGGQDKIKGYASVDMPAGNMDDGVIFNKEKIISTIKEALERSKKIKTDKVICSLPESKAFIRIISIPKMSEEEAKEAVKWEMEANMPMPLADMYFDWQFLGESQDGKQRVLTAAVSKEVVDGWMDVLSGSELDVHGLEIESIATIRSLVDRNAVQGENSLIVDLGARRTSFIIAEGTVPYFTSSIPFSSEGMNDAIGKGLNISLAEAEAAKINNGIDNSDGNNPIVGFLSSLLENLVVEIIKTMDFYGEMSKQSAGISKIILCGGGSNLKGLPEFLNRRINKEVVLGDPWQNLNFGHDLPPISKEESVRYATVIGLALRANNYGNQA